MTLHGARQQIFIAGDKIFWLCSRATGQTPSPGLLIDHRLPAKTCLQPTARILGPSPLFDSGSRAYAK